MMTPEESARLTAAEAEVQRLTALLDTAATMMQERRAASRRSHALVEARAAAAEAQVAALRDVVVRLNRGLSEYAAYHGPSCDEHEENTAGCNRCAIDYSFPGMGEVSRAIDSTASAAAGWCRIEERDAAIRERDEARAEIARVDVQLNRHRDVADRMAQQNQAARGALSTIVNIADGDEPGDLTRAAALARDALRGRP